METHISVMHKEVLAGLNIKPKGTYVDMTLGAGGHAASILQQLQGGTLVAVDLEKAAIDKFAANLGLQQRGADYVDDKQNRVILVNTNFASVAELLAEKGIAAADGVIADLGWSSEQLERIPGLSYQGNDALDMRLDTTQMVTAAQILNTATPDQLSQIFTNFADIHGNVNTSLVKAIVSRRHQQALLQVGDLRSVVESLPAYTHSGTQLVARVFQALRIAVNNELSILQSALTAAWEVLALDGRFLVITFHSGEAHIVSTYFTEWVRAGKGNWLFNKTYLQPTVAELRQNLRAHSAKLWGITKIS